METVSKEPSPMVLHPVQKAFVDSNAVSKGFVAGVGSGKSFVGAYDLLVKAEPGTLCMVISPTYMMLRDSTQRTFIEIATKLGLWDETKHRKSDNIAQLKDGKEILFRSADDPGHLRGPTVRRIWMDECSQMKEEAFNVLIGRLRWGGEQGALSGTFTPSGRSHWTYRIFGDTTNPNVALFHCSTKSNPFISPEFYENLLLQYGKGEGGMLRARQELEGEFLNVHGAEWPPEWFGPDVWFDTWPDDDQAVKAVALDSSKGIGGKTGDYSVFAIGMVSRGKLYVEFDLDNTRNASGMAARAVEIQKSFAPHYFGVEAEFGGNVMVDDLANRAEDANILMPLVAIPTGGVSKDVRIRRLTPYFAQGLIRFKNNDMTKRAVQMIEDWAPPHSEHDDAQDACEMLVRLINESGML